MNRALEESEEDWISEENEGDKIQEKLNGQISYDIDNFSEIKVAFLQSWANAFVLQTVAVCLHLKVLHVLIEMRSISSHAIDMILELSPC